VRRGVRRISSEDRVTHIVRGRRVTPVLVAGRARCFIRARRCEEYGNKARGKGAPATRCVRAILSPRCTLEETLDREKETEDEVRGARDRDAVKNSIPLRGGGCWCRLMKMNEKSTAARTLFVPFPLASARAPAESRLRGKAARWLTTSSSVKPCENTLIEIQRKGSEGRGLTSQSNYDAPCPLPLAGAKRMPVL